jgi:putative ABC transport system permease protein
VRVKRDNRELGTMGRLGRDARYAVRRLIKNPGFSAVAVFTVAVGIGANTAIFSVVNAVLLKPLPYDQGDRLVALWEHRLESDNDRNVANPGNVRDWRARAASFDGIAAASMAFGHVFESSDGAKEVQAIAAEHDFLRVLGVQPQLGNHLQADGGLQILLTHDFWSREFGGDPSVVGTAMSVDGNSGEIVGVLPDEYLVWGEEVDFYFGNSIERADRTNSGRWLTVVGRLAEGVGIDAAREEMLAIAAQLREEDPGFNGGWSINVLPLKEEVVGDARTLMLVLMGAVGLLLLISCANVANLLLARATGRQQEMAVRRSIGATRGTLARQLLVEAGILAALGTAVGLVLAHFGSAAIVRSLPVAFGLPRADTVALDLPVLLFTAGAAVATAVLFGLLPAIQASGTGPGAVLVGESRGPSRRSGRLRNGLVVAEVAFSMVLLASAALMTRSFANLMAVDSGLDVANVVSARVAMTGPAYDEESARIAFARAFQDEIEAIPGVEAAGGVSWLPFNGVRAGTSYWRTDLPIPPTEDQRAADILNTTGDYFEAMGIQVVRGRRFDERDREDSPRVAIVNQTLAEAMWPGEDPIGRSLTYSWRGHETVEVVGVIADVKADGLGESVDEAIYMPMSQTPYFGWNNIVVRTSVDPTSIVPELRARLADRDAAVPLSRVAVVDDLVRRSIARPRVSAFLMGAFAIAAALLAAVGLYGVLSYTVARRVREIGVRVALGARPGRVLAMVVRQGTGMILVGLALGVVGALATTSLLESMLFGVDAADPLSLLTAGSLLFGVGLIACAVPALRATRVAPAQALQAE